MARTKRPPSYRLHKARNCAVVTIDGIDNYLGPHGSAASWQRYAALVHQWESRQSARPALRIAKQTPSELTVGELILEFWKHVTTYYRKNGEPTTEVENFRQALRPLRILHVNTRVGDFGPLALRDTRDLMLKGWSYEDECGRERRTRRCRTTINKDVNRIRQMFKWGVENELVPPMILEGLRALSPLKKGRSEAREPKPVRPVSLRDVVKTLKWLSPQAATMVRLHYLTGARPAEICNLRPADIVRKRSVWEYTPCRHKLEHLERERVVILGPRAQRLLAPWLERPPESFCFSPREAELERNKKKRQGRRSPLTPSQRARNRASKRCKHVGDKYDVTDYARAVRRAAKKAGVSSWSPNQLRHTRATHLRRRYGIESAKAVLGHTELETTQVYAELDLRRAAQVVLVLREVEFLVLRVSEWCFGFLDAVLAFVSFGFSALCQSGTKRGKADVAGKALVRRSTSAPESALGLLPSRALSSAQVDRDVSRPRFIRPRSFAVVFVRGRLRACGRVLGRRRPLVP